MKSSILLAAALALPAAVWAQTASGKTAAYDISIRCFIAGVEAEGRGDLNPKGSRTVAIRADARRAYNAAFKTGGALGFGEGRIKQDIAARSEPELQRYLHTSGYFDITRSMCQKLGFMS